MMGAMSWRYFCLDLTLNVAFGAAVGGLTALAVSPSWPGPLAMVVGMVGGMVIAFPFATVAGIWMGAFEVMLPSMLTGMTAGMFAAMRAAGDGLDLSGGAALGSACGAASFLYSALLNLYLRGAVAR